MNGSKRRTLGGRGREWAQRCYKLLEDMFELDSSKPFQNPVNELQNPDYYSTVTKHMDLSKVQMNLHTGEYDSPIQFAEDIRLIFANWKSYIKDKKSPVLSQVSQLAWYFEQEFEPIGQAWETTAGRPKRVRPSQQTVQCTTFAQPIRMTMPATMTPVAVSISDVTPVVSQIPKSLVTVRNPMQTMVATPVMARNGAAVPSGATVSPVPLQAPIFHPVSTAAAVSPAAAPDTSMNVEMKIEVTNIWFGPCRVKPHRLVHLTEQGMKIFFNVSGKEIEFDIQANEIVRAMGHLSKSRKHTLFLFVAPMCDKRLRDLATEHMIFGSKPKGDPCSLYAIFIKSLLPMQVSRLIHIFWNISKTSIYAPVFSEVDQKGALTILANIKPQIMDRIVEKVTDTLQNNRTILGTAKAVPAGGPPAVNTFMVNMSENRASPLPTISGSSTRENSPAPGSSGGAALNGQAPSDGPPASKRSRRHSSDSDFEDLEIVVPSDEEEEILAQHPEDNSEGDIMMTGQKVSIKCPITQSTMKCPMRNEICGHSYDRNGVQQLILNRGDKAKCPVPGCSNTKPLQMNHLSFDYEVIKVIQNKHKVMTMT